MRGHGRAYCEYYKQTFGPVIALYDALAEQPEQAARLDSDFLDFATRADHGSTGDAAELRFEYLVVIARKRPAG